jgi:RNA polymerase sigma-70 factor, ECF subfamily
VPRILRGQRRTADQISAPVAHRILSDSAPQQVEDIRRTMIAVHTSAAQLNHGVAQTLVGREIELTLGVEACIFGRHRASLQPIGPDDRSGRSVFHDQMVTNGIELNVFEQVLIRRVHAGDAEAFYQLVRPYERAVFLAAVAIVKNDADAEEVAQEAILKAFKALGRFRQEAMFSTWLIQIAINEAKMSLRKDRRHLYESIDQGQQTDDGDYIPKDFADWREIPSQALERRELREALAKALESLPEKYRTILILRDVNHLSITETAQILGLSEANVKTRLSRARLQMRDALASGFGGLWSGRSGEKVQTS